MAGRSPCVYGCLCSRRARRRTAAAAVCRVGLARLEYALYGSYESVIKTVVWPDPTVPHTIGLTGILLSHNLHRWVEFVQA